MTLRRKKPLPRSTKPIARSARPQRSGPPKARNVMRASRNWIRAYESEARVKWVASLPCVVPGCLAEKSQNVHTGRGAGTGFKGPSTEIFPGCAPHHHALHQYGAGWFARQYGVTMAMLYDAAEATEAAWRILTGETR